jgi:hypothetical protein
MFRSWSAAAVILAFAALLPAAPAPGPASTAIDLKPHINQNSKSAFHGDLSRPNNNLAELPRGKKTLAGVKFTLGDGVVQLGSLRVRGPQKVTGIKVGRKFTTLRILHSCGCGGYDPAGTVIGKYVVHYDDKTTAEIKIVYGKDVVDWWIMRGQKDATHSKVGWEGTNGAARAVGAKIKLSLTSWKNPHPRKKVVSIDYVAAVPRRHSAPFCVAITAEDK